MYYTPELREFIKVKIKKLVPEAVIPTYAKPGDAGMDLTAIKVDLDMDGNIIYHTGLAFEVPQGFVGLLFPRSSNSKKDMYLTNHVGVIDSGYRGEICLKYRPTHLHGALRPPQYYAVGDRVGQIIVMPYPQIEFEEAELSDSERGTGAYGSSGA